MIVTRFAPSPTGYLHAGHAFAALTARLAAKQGRFHVRIEDLDRSRSRAHFIDAIFEDLRWLGITWEEPVMRQSERAPLYRAAVDRLAARGLLYPCFCTRTEIADEIARAAEAPHSPDGPLYPGTCRLLSRQERDRRIALGMSHALRLDSGKAAECVPPLVFEEIGAGAGSAITHDVNPLLFGDIVIARKDVAACYHLAVVVDDAEQGVTLITRGCDLLPATHVQRVLQQLLGLPIPQYAHHRLVLDSAGNKLSKRRGAETLRDFRARGTTPSQILALIEDSAGQPG